METVIVFVLTLGLIIFVHELGHFFAARRVGIGVEEFAFGFPPRLFSVKRGKTKYSLNLIPIGGYVKLVGEENTSKAKNSFSQKSAGQRAFVIVAGVVMNFILASILFGIGFGLGMEPIASNPNTLPGSKETKIIVVDAVADGAAKAVGLEPRDVLLDFKTVEELQAFTDTNKGKIIKLNYQRNDEIKSVDVRLSESDSPLGVYIQPSTKVKMPIWQAIGFGFVEAGRGVVFMINYLIDLVTQLFHGNKELASGLSGPVGVFKFTGLAIELGFVVVIQLIALLSLNIALVNILPLPALDGGKLLFVGLEKVFKRKVVREEIENLIHFVGFALLVILLVVITYFDIKRFY